MAFLSKDQILKADDMVYAEVDVPEWGGTARLRTLTGEQRDEFESSQIKLNKKGRPEQNMSNLRARLVALVVVDESDAPVFSGYDIPDLGRKSARALDRVYEKAAEMNGFSEEDMKELAEGFAPGQNAVSTSD